MATYVLVGGAWIGAWAWQDVAERLRTLGHTVWPLSLTGLGERVAEGGPETDLDRHISDIVELLGREDLRDVILVGHSYSGVPITGAADRAHDRIAQLVYVDTTPIPDSTAFISAYPPAALAFVEEQAAKHGDGWRWPLPSWDDLTNLIGASLTGISEEWLAAFRAQAVGHPLGTFRQPLTLTHPDRPPHPKLGVLCAFGEAHLRQMIEAGHPWARCVSGPEWRFVELPTSHWPMFSEPARLAAILHDSSAGQHPRSA